MTYQSKRCLSCSETKPLEDFNRWKLSKDGRQVWCRLCCKKERTANSEHYKEKRATYYLKNREKILTQTKKWVAANPDKRQQIQKRYTKTHYEDVKARARLHYKKYYVADPEKYKALRKNQRHARRKVPGKVTAQEWRSRLEEFNYHCAYCLSPLKEGADTTQDHMIAISKGGIHVIGNIVPACRTCNSRKQHRSLLPWMHSGELPSSQASVFASVA